MYVSTSRTFKVQKASVWNVKRLNLWLWNGLRRKKTSRLPNVVSTRMIQSLYRFLFIVMLDIFWLYWPPILSAFNLNIFRASMIVQHLFPWLYMVLKRAITYVIQPGSINLLYLFRCYYVTDTNGFDKWEDWLSWYSPLSVPWSSDPGCLKECHRLSGWPTVLQGETDVVYYWKHDNCRTRYCLVQVVNVSTVEPPNRPLSLNWHPLQNPQIIGFL